MGEIEHRVPVLALIPARSGSKSIPHKNIANFAGKPLIAHSIEQARQCPLVERVIVSTDSELYAGIARQYGAETPFLRPAEISADFSTDLEVFQHALRWLAEHEGYRPEICVHLRPTHPNRRVEDISAVVRLLLEHPEWTSVRSVVPAPETPFKMWFKAPDGTMRPVVECELPEAHSRPRQALPAVYLQNACVDAIRTSTLLEGNSIAGAAVGAYEMRDFHDIDTPEQMQRAEQALRREPTRVSGKTFCFDIDGVIATLTPGNDYAKAQPLTETVRRINRLHEAGNKIILFTARGSMTGIDWSEVTHRQMNEWGVKHHELRFGKPAADYYIDDRFVSLGDVDQMIP